VSDADFWQAVLYLHLLAMAFFVGGQLVFGVAVVPVLRGDSTGPGRDRMRRIARRFGVGSLLALAVLVLTGWPMASHYGLWAA
jgi:putative copper export protein